jgi:hypothetical protein
MSNMNGFGYFFVYEKTRYIIDLYVSRVSEPARVIIMWGEKKEEDSALTFRRMR